MPYITRDDGERFIIPSYRDTLRAVKPSLLKREIMLLATSYGDYAALQKKGRDEFEIAFATESGYLLGETVWAHFNRPRDLVYCEAIPNTTDAILVIVKGGSVYLDGSFPIDSIAEELVIFKTQQNEFDVYIYGDVPISQTPEENKFSFDTSSVHTFSILEKPIFQTLPIIKAFELQLIDVILKRQGIGVFPVKYFATGLLIVIIGWFGWNMLGTEQVTLPPSIANVVNPYQLFVSALTSPSPDQQVQTIINQVTLLNSIPGWFPTEINYTNDTTVAVVESRGALLKTLSDWAKYYKATVNIDPQAVNVTLSSHLSDRNPPQYIYRTNEVIERLIDRLYYVIPGNSITINASENKGQYTQISIHFSFTNISLASLSAIGQRLKDLPVILSAAKITISDNTLSGSLDLIVLGK